MDRELRMEKRIPVDLFQEDMRVLGFSIGFFDDNQGQLINMSKSGISFLATGVDYKRYEIGHKIKIVFFSKNIKVIGKIIYIIRLSDNEAKIGVNFSPSTGVDEIGKVIDGITTASLV